jgi:hypothetical protein
MHGKKFFLQVSKKIFWETYIGPFKLIEIFPFNQVRGDFIDAFKGENAKTFDWV